MNTNLPNNSRDSKRKNEIKAKEVSLFYGHYGQYGQDWKDTTGSAIRGTIW